MKKVPKIPYAALERLPNVAKARMAKDGAEIIIGGDNAARGLPNTVMLPEAYCHKWDHECWIKVSHADVEHVRANDRVNESRDIDTGNLTIEMPVSAKKRSHKVKAGSLEWDVEYQDPSALPADGKERFTLDFPAGLAWIYQPALLQAELDAGDLQPIDMIGSYVAKFNQSGRYLDASGEELVNYGNGKFCYLKRPKWFDAAGNVYWGNQLIDGYEHTVDIPPREWLDAAVWPVTLDPTFGFDSVTGSSNKYVATGVALACAIPAPASNGTLDSISLLLNTYANDITVGLLSGTTTPDTTVEAMASATLSGKQWHEIDSSTTPAVATDGEYHIGATAATNGLYFYRDAGTAQSNWDTSYTYVSGVFDTSGMATYQTSYDYGCYATYTESGGGTTYYQDVSGNMPAASGGTTQALTIGQAVSGEMPAASGGVSKTIKKIVIGTMPSPIGAVSKMIKKSVSGNMPANTGSISKTIYKFLSGNMPSPEGELSSSYQTKQGVSGVMGDIYGSVTTVLNPIVVLSKKIIKILGSNFKKFLQ